LNIRSSGWLGIDRSIADTDLDVAEKTAENGVVYGAEVVLANVVKSRNRSVCVKWYPLPALALWMHMS